MNMYTCCSLQSKNIHLIGHTLALTLAIISKFKFACHFVRKRTKIVLDFITNNMATVNIEFSNVMLNSRDFVAKTINVVK